MYNVGVVGKIMIPNAIERILQIYLNFFLINKENLFSSVFFVGHKIDFDLKNSKSKYT